MNEMIERIIKNSLTEEQLDNFKCEQIARGISYKLYTRIIVRLITDLKSLYRLEITDDEGTIRSQIPDKYTVIEKDNRLLLIDLPKNEDVLTECFNDLTNVLSIKKQYIIENYAIDFSFGCCSRYEACSNARKCINPDQKLARGCQYRTSLENGQIFYGVNRNV